MPESFKVVNILVEYGCADAAPKRAEMVMGFNTEIKHKGVTYHVQTEPRRNMRVETTVYIRGAVIHSQMTSCPDLASPPDLDDEALHQKLEEQHRQVIEKIRAGEICFSPSPPAEA